jgi:hypothetical protein
MSILGCNPTTAISPYRGIERISSAPELSALIDLVLSPDDGVTFCQGCFAELSRLLRRYSPVLAPDQALCFALHSAPCTGNMTRLSKSWHDEGDWTCLAA